MSGPIRVLIADDEILMRAALAELISTVDEFELVGAASDTQEAISMASEHRPDVAVLDVKMPGGGGARAAARIRDICADTKVLALSAYGERSFVLEMLRCGAVGYLLKGALDDEIFSAIRGAAAGSGVLAGEVTGEVIGELATRLDRQARVESSVATRRDRIHRVIGDDRLKMLFQPITELASGDVVGFEALARFPEEPPNVWFAAAWELGLGLELEVAAIRAALESFPHLPGGTYLSLNVSPTTLAWPGLADHLSPEFLDRIVLEVTEHAKIDNYEAIGAAMAKFRRHGARLAVDDAGAGFASLRHIVRLGADIIKLDLAVTQELSGNPSVRAMARALIAFAAEVGADVVAEGIETQTELDALAALGASHAQGLFLGRPAPLPGTNGGG